MNDDTRVAIAHDYLTQRGGAERVVTALAKTFPGAPIITAAYDPERTFEFFESCDVQSYFHRDSPLNRADTRQLLPILPFVWRRIRPVDADVVICSSSGWSHAIRTSGRKIVYCHNPARWIYQTEDVIASRVQRELFRPVRTALRQLDQRSARTVDRYVANSTTVRQRIRQTYGISAELVFPPLSLTPESGVMEPNLSTEPGYFLTIARGRGYKATSAVTSAFERLPAERLVVVGARSHVVAQNIRYATDVTDDELRWLYSHAKALIAIGNEDFGLTPIEAHSFGTPSILLRAGGYLDSGIEGVNTRFIDEPLPTSLAKVILGWDDADWDRDQIKTSSLRFTEERFGQRMRKLVEDVVDPEGRSSPVVRNGG